MMSPKEPVMAKLEVVAEIEMDSERHTRDRMASCVSRPTTGKRSFHLCQR